MEIDEDPTPNSMDSDVMVVQHATSVSRRPLPVDPTRRLALSWVASVQGRRGKAASCRCCNTQFSRGELRLSKESDYISSSGRHFHLSCIPGGLHAQDIVQGEPTSDPHVMASIDAARANPSDHNSTDAVAHEDRAAYVGETTSDLHRGFAFWSSWDWSNAFRHPHRTFIDVPKSLHSAFAERKQNIISEILQLPHDSPAAVPMWRCLSMFDALVLNSQRQAEESQWEAISRRLQQVDDGDWPSLWHEAVGVIVPGSKETSAAAKRKQRGAFVQSLATAGEHSRAIRAMQEPAEIMRDRSRLKDIENLYPPDPGMISGDRPVAYAWTDGEIDALAKGIAQSLRKAPVRTAPGPLGSRLEHWTVLKYTASGLRDAGRLLARLALGQVPPEMITIHGRGEIIPAMKPSGGLRPILISSVLRRISLKAVAQMARDSVKAFVGNLQLCFAKDGITRAHHAITCLARQDQSRVLLSLDVAAAHQSFSRSAAESAIGRAAPMLQLPWRSWYDGHMVHFWRSSDGGFHEISSVAGADQGCALANLAYCTAVASPLEETFQTLSGLDQGARMFLFSDDIKIWIDPVHLPAAYDSVSSALSQVGLCLCRPKTKVWVPAASVQIPDEFLIFKESELQCLGARLVDDARPSDPALPSVGGEVSSALDTAAARVSSFAARAEDLCNDGLSLQIAQALFRYVVHGSTQHIISAAPVPSAAVDSYDARLRHA